MNIQTVNCELTLTAGLSIVHSNHLEELRQVARFKLGQGALRSHTVFSYGVKIWLDFVTI